MRKYLVFISTERGHMTPELFDNDRLFDVAIHDYSSCYEDKEYFHQNEAEYWFPRPHAEKLETAAVLLPCLPDYSYYAFLDDDLTVTTDQLNYLFTQGDALHLDLYQPALTRNSYSSHKHLYQERRLIWPMARRVPFIEIMCPFFSNHALEACLPLFDINVSGWGLDCYHWPTKFLGYVIDGVAIGHYRQPARRKRVARNGLTPQQECWILGKIFCSDQTGAPPVI